MTQITQEFLDEVNKLAEDNWKIKKLLADHGGNFESLPDNIKDMITKQINEKSNPILNNKLDPLDTAITTVFYEYRSQQIDINLAMKRIKNVFAAFNKNGFVDVTAEMKRWRIDPVPKFPPGEKHDNPINNPINK